MADLWEGLGCQTAASKPSRKLWRSLWRAWHLRNPAKAAAEGLGDLKAPKGIFEAFGGFGSAKRHLRDHENKAVAGGLGGLEVSNGTFETLEKSCGERFSVVLRIIKFCLLGLLCICHLSEETKSIPNVCGNFLGVGPYYIRLRPKPPRLQWSAILNGWKPLTEFWRPLIAVKVGRNLIKFVQI